MHAGFDVQAHALGSSPGVDFTRIHVAVIDAGDKWDAALAQLRRWRAELGDEVVPILWVLPSPNPEAAVAGFDAGADVVLTQPLDPGAFAAQTRSAVRTRTAAVRTAARAAEARMLGEQLTRALTQLDREHDLARRIQLAFDERALPAAGAARFAVCHHARSRIASDFHAAQYLDSRRVVFHVGDVIGPEAAGGFLGRLAADTIARAAPAGAEPGILLDAVTRDLLRLSFADQPLVALLVGILNTETGELGLARAGLPAPIHCPAAGEPVTWAVPGPYLGTAESTYPTHHDVLRTGDKLLIATDGTRPDGDPGRIIDPGLLACVARHRTLQGQAFVDAIGRDLLAEVRHDNDFTLFCVELGSVSPRL